MRSVVRMAICTEDRIKYELQSKTKVNQEVSGQTSWEIGHTKSWSIEYCKIWEHVIFGKDIAGLVDFIRWMEKVRRIKQLKEPALWSWAFAEDEAGGSIEDSSFNDDIKQ